VSRKKKQVRAAFRDLVFARDRYRCCVCGRSGVKLDAHHITDRTLMPGGGYVPENGITLCEPCHAQAEQFHAAGTAAPGFHPDELYARISSSHERACRASLAATSEGD
jgi:hypothetical protein